MRRRAVFSTPCRPPHRACGRNRRWAPWRPTLRQSPLAGLRDDAGAELWQDLPIGRPLNLMREPDNRHDACAVRVDWHGRKLGYVRRRDNAALCQLLDRGEQLTADIAALAESRDSSQRVHLAINLGV